MKQLVIRASLLATLALGANQQALAHIKYTDIGALGSFTDTVLTTYGFNQGQIQPSATSGSLPQGGALATTDDLGWYSFTLTKASDVTLNFTNAGIAAASNPLTALGLSLYSGIFVTNSFDALTPAHYAAISAANIAKTPYPLTTQANERGLVNTAGSFSMTTDTANANNNIRTVNYIASATDGGTGTASLIEHNLAAGTYTVIGGGNLAWNINQDGIANSAATISFTSTPAVSAVPVPGAVWLMGTALAGFRLFGQRKNRLAA